MASILDQIKAKKDELKAKFDEKRAGLTGGEGILGNPGILANVQNKIKKVRAKIASKRSGVSTRVIPIGQFSGAPAARTEPLSEHIESLEFYS